MADSKKPGGIDHHQLISSIMQSQEGNPVVTPVAHRQTLGFQLDSCAPQATQDYILQLIARATIIVSTNNQQNEVDSSTSHDDATFVNLPCGCLCIRKHGLIKARAFFSNEAIIGSSIDNDKGKS